MLSTLHSSKTVSPANDIPLIPTDINSHQLSSYQCINIVGRNYSLVTLRSKRVEGVIPISHINRTDFFYIHLCHNVIVAKVSCANSCNQFLSILIKLY